MVVAGYKNKSIGEAMLQFAVRNLEHILQPIKGRLEYVETSLQSIQTTMVTILQSISGLGLDPLQPRTPLVNVQHQEDQGKIETNTTTK